MQTAQRQGGHPLRVVPRCDVNRVHSIRFTCQVRWAGLVGSEAPFLVDRVQALLCDRHSGMTLSRPRNRAATRLEEGPGATSRTRFQRCPGCCQGASAHALLLA